ncbi:hypothetical protein P3X46_014875 [Hevea brasiliensis]|uniref:Transcriptional coactivator p15 (PC4) C-terminal domain-containing protein n=1 Tax=Hevea brasiliensis TaxID=3981 RepID=A0ABQ9LU73_HEVBR|nr:hypothetical protein P3X46_014875 [Hevea brasiliensis]
MEPEILLKMEEAVIDILKKADMDYMTEFNVRVAASERIVDDFVLIREFYHNDGTHLPSNKLFFTAAVFSGISLTAEQWSAFRKSIPLIEEAIIRMKSKLCNRRLKPCPSVAVRPEASAEEIAQDKASEQSGLVMIICVATTSLTSLSDALYYQYSKKTKSAREPWEEPKLVYLYEELGKKRSQVRNYIEFQIKFHVGAIISKVHPSWKDFCIKLMCEEYLPFGMLMERVRMEEQSRNQDKQVEPSNSVRSRHAKNLGPRMKDGKKARLNGKKRETDR